MAPLERENRVNKMPQIIQNMFSQGLQLELEGLRHIPNKRSRHCEVAKSYCTANIVVKFVNMIYQFVKFQKSKCEGQL